jgi:hypothetical protein
VFSDGKYAYNRVAFRVLQHFRKTVNIAGNHVIGELASAASGVFFRDPARVIRRMRVSGLDIVESCIQQGHAWNTWTCAPGFAFR